MSSDAFTDDDARFLRLALDEARGSAEEGGIPIGSVLVLDGEVVGRGHNRRVQLGDPILHAEMDALRNAGRRTAAEYRGMTIYTTLSPCQMCTGAVLLYGIPRIVIGESQSFTGPEWLLEQSEVTIARAESHECRELMARFMTEHPELWNEDIGR